MNLSKFKLVKALDRELRVKNNIDRNWLNKKYGLMVNDPILTDLRHIYQEIRHIRSYINKLVFDLYGLTKDEEILVSEGV